jgi:hypothetical protein
MKNAAFLDVTPCGTYRRANFKSHIVFSATRLPIKGAQGVTTQKTAFFNKVCHSLIRLPSKLRGP